MDPQVKPFLEQLDRFLQDQQDRPAPLESANGGSGGITSGMRDGSAHVLRCLKVWYDLPSDVFFNAVSSIDKFLAKMKAQPKHLSCIAVSAFHLACQQQQKQQQRHMSIPDPADLVNISQSRCSPSDLLRMQSILASKICCTSNNSALDLLRIMFLVSKATAEKLGFGSLIPEQNLPARLIHQLEILSCDSAVWLGPHRPVEVALSVLTAEFRRRGTQLMSVVAELQRFCSVSASAFVDCLGVTVAVLERYNSAGSVAHRQRLTWKLSNRTLRHLRPTDRLRPTLPTIEETMHDKHRQRSNSECSEESMASSLLGSESDSDSMEMEEEQFAYFQNVSG